MRIEVVGKNVPITDAMKNITENKVEKLNRYVILGDDVKARVLARTYRDRQKVEITVWSDVGILRAEVEASDYYEALNLAMDKIIGQIRRQKTRLIDKHKEHIANALVEEAAKEEGENTLTVKTKTFALEMLDVEAAVLQMELLGHSFFAFIDEETEKPAIVYRRHDETYGLIELDM